MQVLRRIQNNYNKGIAMLQCIDCEFCIKDEAGRIQMRCNPFVNVKEPECIQKWVLMKTDMLLRSYQSMLEFYRQLAPLQERMLKHIERELDDVEEADKWKYGDEEDDESDELDDLSDFDESDFK